MTFLHVPFSVAQPPMGLSLPPAACPLPPSTRNKVMESSLNRQVGNYGFPPQFIPDNDTFSLMNLLLSLSDSDGNLLYTTLVIQRIMPWLHRCSLAFCENQCCNACWGRELGWEWKISFYWIWSFSFARWQSSRDLLHNNANK